MRPLCAAMLRVKNESRWIDEVIRSIYPVCHRIFILDDHSSDNTVEICTRFPNVTAIHSSFSGLDESRDKEYLYESVLTAYGQSCHGAHWPLWILAIDGDEVLDQRDLPALFALMTGHPDVAAWKLQIVYLWNDRNHVRVDGVYGSFARPSLWRVMNPGFKFQTTPWGRDPQTGQAANFHCSSIPQELLYQAQWSEVRLNHLGYMDAADRKRKLEWYRKIDPDNPSEDNYRHITQGDDGGEPADARLMHAGPLRLEEVR